MKKKVRLVLFVVVMAALYAVPFSIVTVLLKVYDSFWSAYLYLYLPSVIAIAAGLTVGLKNQQGKYQKQNQTDRRVGGLTRRRRDGQTG